MQVNFLEQVTADTHPCIGRLCVSICDVTSCMFIGRPGETKKCNISQLKREMYAFTLIVALIMKITTKV